MKVQRLLFVLVSVAVGLATTLANEEEDKLLEEIVEVIEKGLKNKASKIIKNKKNGPRSLACPQAPAHGPIPMRTEKVCRRNRQCEDGEKCCDWADTKHCLKGISKKKRLGQCPQITQQNDACYSEGSSCRFDNECSGEDEKCCLNRGCRQRQCLSIRQNLGCPRPKSLVFTERTEVNCTKDTECATDEKCCDWSGSKHCLKGISTISKPGPCLNTPDTGVPCIADLPSCDYDAECSGINDKCCLNHNCGYNECVDMNKYFVCPDVEQLPTSTAVSKCSAENNTCGGFGNICCPTAVNAAGQSIYDCVEGIDRHPKPGQCPPAEHLSFPGQECLQDYEGGCEYDDDCFGKHKCCETSCGYNECVKLNNDENSGDDAIMKRILSLLTSES